MPIPQLQGLPSLTEAPDVTHEYIFWDLVLAHMDTYRDHDILDLLAVWAQTKQGSKSSDAVQKFVEAVVEWADFTSDRYAAIDIAHRYYLGLIDLNSFSREVVAVSN